MSLAKLSESKMFGGRWLRYRHDSATVGTPMEFSVYLPPAASDTNRVKVLYWLSGLTCTDKNFMEKAGAQRIASKLNLALVAPDTSPRNPPDQKLPGEDASWDFGAGAGFYVDATQAPWDRNYKMYSYVTSELPQLVEANFPIVGGPDGRSVFGHSMGGHGALVVALRNPGQYRSVSAFAPISNPSNCPWGKKALGNYLGDNQDTWKAYDASELVRKYEGPELHILVNQGTADQFLKDGQLLPELLSAAAGENARVHLDLRMDEGYDHSYNHIATFVEDHIRHHARHLGVL
eukprot:TRINITY_DN13352_c0_g1_i1.p2 TRINITY_DN13352_c0_g1~~TRINITY_DN13352_c0_g1_i1.p2  ORF type:complete len:291 (+),score=61.65 TRINITY_DN13352_c0_g1_i1:42-914(+)